MTPTPVGFFYAALTYIFQQTIEDIDAITLEVFVLLYESSKNEIPGKTTNS